MKRTLVLLAGPPATGKSFLIAKIRQVIPDFFLITPDEIKEMFADRRGFTNLEEKSKLEVEVWQFYYQILQEYMIAGKKVIISEYPFSDKQKKRLEKLSKKNGYQLVTIRLVADFDILWERRKARDLEITRHLSHLMTHYQSEDTLLNRSLADNHITKQQFEEIINKRKYNKFKLGELLEVDVSDFKKVDYNKLIEQLQSKL